jgi:hypothetical protein
MKPMFNSIYTSTRPRDPDEPRCLSNMEKKHKAAVLKAIAASGQAVEWRDEPDERMPSEMRADYGSVWSAERDCSQFWDEYRAFASAE